MPAKSCGHFTQFLSLTPTLNLAIFLALTSEGPHCLRVLAQLLDGALVAAARARQLTAADHLTQTLTLALAPTLTLTPLTQKAPRTVCASSPSSSTARS